MTRIEGEPSKADLAELDRIVAELNELRNGPEIRRGAPAEESNVTLHFAHASTFGEILPQYVPGNLGFFWYGEASSMTGAHPLPWGTRRWTARSSESTIYPRFSPA